MTTKELINVADIFLEISGEAVLKRRQGHFLDLYNLNEEHKSFLTRLAALSLALNTSLDIIPKITINTLDLPFSEAAGKVFYYVLEGEDRKARKELHKLPHYLQVILSFVLTKKIITQVSHEFLFNILDIIPTLPEMLSKFVILPTEIPKEEPFLEKVVSFSSPEAITFPFSIVKRARAQRTRGKLYYLVKGAKGISSNIPNKMVKDYLAKGCDLTQYGLIISLVFNKKKSRVKYVQIITFSEDPYKTKEYFQGKAKELPKQLKFNQHFKVPPQTIDIVVKYPLTIDSEEEFKNSPWLLLNGNLILYKSGISILENKAYKVRGKVVDWLLSDKYEPLGYKVLVQGTIYDVRCTISNSDVDRGIEGLFLNLKQTRFMGEVIRTDYFSALSHKFRECALCGKVESLISKHLCYTCHTKLFKIAVATPMDKFEYDETPPFKSGITFPIYKFDVTFTDVSVSFEENLELVKGEQLRLPCDWWDKDEWRWKSYGSS